MVIWLQGVLLTDSRETREAAHQVLWPQSDRMKHNETWHRPNTNYHLSVIHLGHYRNLSIAVHEGWYLFQLEIECGPKSHCAICKKAKALCIRSASFWCKMSGKTAERWWMQSMQLRSHPFGPDIAGDRSSLFIASPDGMTLWCAVRAVNARV